MNRIVEALREAISLLEDASADMHDFEDQCVVDAIDELLLPALPLLCTIKRKLWIKRALAKAYRSGWPRSGMTQRLLCRCRSVSFDTLYRARLRRLNAPPYRTTCIASEIRFLCGRMKAICVCMVS
jgi:hypothetical protein